MSGGHWDYNHFRLQEILEEVGQDRQIEKRFPNLTKTFCRLGKTLSNMIHELDYDLSGDSDIEDDKAFEEKYIKSLMADKLIFEDIIREKDGMETALEESRALSYLLLKYVRDIGYWSSYIEWLDKKTKILKGELND